MKRTHICFPEEMLRSVDRRVEKTGAPVSELIRRAVSTWLKELRDAK